MIQSNHFKWFQIFIGRIEAPQWSFVFSLSNEVNRHSEYQLNIINIKFYAQTICNEWLYFRINSFYCIFASVCSASNCCIFSFSTFRLLGISPTLEIRQCISALCIFLHDIFILLHFSISIEFKYLVVNAVKGKTHWKMIMKMYAKVKFIKKSTACLRQKKCTHSENCALHKKNRKKMFIKW